MPSLALPECQSLTPDLIQRIALALARYGDTAAYPDLAAPSARFGEGSDALERFMKDGRDLAEEVRAQYRAGHTDAVPELLHRLHATLQHYGNLATYQAPRVGGVVAGCPRGPRPQAKSLAFDARVMSRSLRESVYGALLTPPGGM